MPGPTLLDPLLRQPMIVDRDIGKSPQVELPARLRVVSADSHLEIGDDIFIDKFPDRLKNKAPRVWFDKYWHIGYKGETEALKLGERGTNSLIRSNLASVADVAAHRAAIDAEGIEFEILFPQTLIGFIRYPDLEIQENMYRVYNEYTMDRLKANDGRSVPVGVFSNWWDADAADRAIQQIVDLGYKTFMIPCAPGKDRKGRELSYADEHFDRFWSLANEAGLPVCFHIGEAIDIDRRGGVGAANMVLFAPFRRPFGQMVFGGVFDRNPNLQVMFAEGGIAWVPPALQDAEAQFDIHAEILDPIKHRPSHYWHTHCHATFQNDRLGLSQIDLIGADRILWASDYPHSEGSYGYGRESMKVVIDMVGEQKARLILGENAIRMFKLDEIA
jgi:predicted TIM-barrel fold metal-dependent hydrolase